jgi:L-2-hydroxycarboxylate dehydrogenase (NAD+)
MKVKIDEVRTTLEKIITNKGMGQTDAEILADEFLSGELNGKKSHGLAAFPAVMPKLSDELPDMKILRESDSALYIDANGNFGAIVGRKITNQLIDKAKNQGVAIAFIRNMKPWLRPGAIAEYIAAHDMVGFVTNTGGQPMVAPPGGRDPVIGTNPIGIAIPADEQPVVADMATSKRAWGEVRLAKRFGHDLPPDSFYNKNGQITLNPDEAYSALPFGDYKGFALGLLIEIMSGAFVDMPMNIGSKDEPYYRRPRSAMILVMDPNFTVGAKKFKEENQAFIDTIRQSAPLPDSTGVTLPGDHANKSKVQNLERDYLEIDDKLWQEILSFL